VAISYDSNIITGGFGARYFGTGGSVKWQDRVSIYLE
jgi:curli production assembly/transport component CsgG